MAEYVHFSSDDLKEIEAQFRKLIYGQGFTILVVDKSPVSRRTLVNDLKSSGYEAVEEASKQSEALSLLVKCEGKVALITDVDLPGVDGIGLIRSFMEAEPAGTAILTGDRTPRDKITAAIAAGAKGFFPKPLNLADVKQKLVDLGFAIK